MRSEREKKKIFHFFLQPKMKRKLNFTANGKLLEIDASNKFHGFQPSMYFDLMIDDLYFN